MQILIRHAVAQKKHILAQKIGELALQKAQELEMEQRLQSVTPEPRHLPVDDFQMDDAEAERLLKVADGAESEKKSDAIMVKVKKKNCKAEEKLLAALGVAGSMFIPKPAAKNGSNVEPKETSTPIGGERLNPFKVAL